jgi:hypothetical protein
MGDVVEAALSETFHKFARTGAQFLTPSLQREVKVGINFENLHGEEALPQLLCDDGTNPHWASAHTESGFPQSYNLTSIERVSGHRD